nr:immunoglobulin heavy chain junction region [Macaca mulatta]MOW88360.1 immunoglobulin heavy chain junction region [Macaca mulatta]MOW88791.1 immunoglobulin heavy chain junction region [Macaca mulatta]MOW88997.1 immunoglobulin heavy chain junction region [Macaca mulatta]MOW89257.1 immunoglobulin heavy chain junction region [Macaca mulatta]
CARYWASSGSDFYFDYW